MDELIARHAFEEKHWSGLGVDKIMEKIGEVRSGHQEAVDFGGGRRIYRKGDTILIEDGNGGGTIFRPKWCSAARYLKWFIGIELRKARGQ